jgi:hypothetical protein
VRATLALIAIVALGNSAHAQWPSCSGSCDCAGKAAVGLLGAALQGASNPTSQQSSATGSSSSQHDYLPPGYFAFEKPPAPRELLAAFPRHFSFAPRF